MRAVAALMMVPGAGNKLMTKYSAQKYVRFKSCHRMYLTDYLTFQINIHSLTNS